MGLLDGLLGTGEPGIKVGDAAPEFDLTDAAGKRPPLGLPRQAQRRPVLLSEGRHARLHEGSLLLPRQLSGVHRRRRRGRRRQLRQRRVPPEVRREVPPPVHARQRHRRHASAKRYGVPATLGLLPGRVTFVIDRDGIVRHVFNSQLQATEATSTRRLAVRRL